MFEEKAGYEWRVPEGERWSPAMIDRFRLNPNLHLVALHGLEMYQTAEQRDRADLSGLSDGQQMLLTTSRVECHVYQAGFEKLWCYDGWALAPAGFGYELIGAARLVSVVKRALAAANWLVAGLDSVHMTDEEQAVLLELSTEFYQLTMKSQAPTTSQPYDLNVLKNTYIVSHPHEFPELAF